MEAPSHKSSFWQHKGSMVPLLLLMLATLTYSQILAVHGFWRAACDLLTGSTRSAPFLLLNFVIVTIIARSKSEYVTNKHGHRACKNAGVKPERKKKKKEEEEEEVYKTPLIAEPHEKRHASGEMSPVRNDVLLIDMKELNATREMEDEAPTTQEVPGSSSPSSEEVWAAIMARNHTKDDHESHHKVVAHDDSQENWRSSSSRTLSRDQRCLAPESITNTFAPPYQKKFGTISHHISMHHESEKGSRDDVKNEEEMEELKRRADKFIERFNLQMRLQRQESLHRRCTQISEPPPYWAPPIPTCSMVKV